MRISDRAIFKSTRAALREDSPLPPYFKALIQWFELHAGISVVHLFYEAKSEMWVGPRRQLTLILKSQSDREKLYRGQGQITAKWQKTICDVLCSILQQQGIRSKYALSDILLTAETVPNLAILEAKRSITPHQNQQMLQRLHRYGLLELKNNFEATELVVDYSKSIAADPQESDFHLRRIYFDYLKFHDALDCLTPAVVPLQISPAQSAAPEVDFCIHY